MLSSRACDSLHFQTNRQMRSMWNPWRSLYDVAICVDDEDRGARGTWMVQSFHLFLPLLFCLRMLAGRFRKSTPTIISLWSV